MTEQNDMEQYVARGLDATCGDECAHDSHLEVSRRLWAWMMAEARAARPPRLVVIGDDAR